MGDWTKYISFTCWGSCRYGGIPEIFGCLSSAGKVFDSIAELKSWKKDRQRRDHHKICVYGSHTAIWYSKSTDRQVYYDLTKWQDVWKHSEELSIHNYVCLLGFFGKQVAGAFTHKYPQIVSFALSPKMKLRIWYLVHCPKHGTHVGKWSPTPQGFHVHVCRHASKPDSKFIKIYFFSRLACASHLAMEY